MFGCTHLRSWLSSEKQGLQVQPRYNQPTLAQDKKPLKFDLMDSLVKDKIEQVCADAALDEQVGAELLQKEFKSLKVRTKDATHATRRTSCQNHNVQCFQHSSFQQPILSVPLIIAPARISSRATSADPYLGKTLSIFVSSKNSPAQLIHFRRIFCSQVRTVHQRIKRMVVWLGFGLLSHKC